MAKEDKLKALDAAIAKIEKDFGKGYYEAGGFCGEYEYRGDPYWMP